MPRYTASLRTASRDCWLEFRKTYPSIEITYEEYKNIIYTDNANRMFHVLETGEELPLPYGFGKISIQRKKTIPTYTDTKTGYTHIILPVDWKKTKETGKKVYFYNDHTEGWRFKWVWFKHSSTGLKMKDVWSFKVAREWSEQLNKFVTREDKKYLFTYTEYQVGRNAVKNE